MESTLSWLDTSEADRRRAMDVIDILRQKDTLDELGIGSVRDAIAEVLSPGTSTIQRRARYFFFVPWIYQSIEKSSAKSAEVADRARRVEIALIDALAESVDPEGTIGIEARGGLKRLPSMIYWAGLGRLGFRRFSGSQDQYHRVVSRGRIAPSIDDAGDLGLDGLLGPHWHPRLPEATKEFPSEAVFAMRKVESEFFVEQLRIHAGDSLLLFLADLGDRIDQLEYPWLHPGIDEMPKKLRRWVHHGQMYSELMLGAAYLYNLMLSEQLPHEEWIEHYRAKMAEWAALAGPRLAIYGAWRRDEFWRDVMEVNPRLPIAARHFSESWIQVAIVSRFKGLFDHGAARALVTDRERRLKGRRARLGNREQLLLWGGASGAFQLDYRWGITKTVVNDIVAGLGS